MKLLALFILVSISAGAQTKDAIKKAMRDKTKKYTVEVDSVKYGRNRSAVIATDNTRYLQTTPGINAAMTGTTIKIRRK